MPYQQKPDLPNFINCQDPLADRLRIAYPMIQYKGQGVEEAIGEIHTTDGVYSGGPAATSGRWIVEGCGEAAHFFGNVLGSTNSRIDVGTWSLGSNVQQMTMAGLFRWHSISQANNQAYSQAFSKSNGLFVNQIDWALGSAPFNLIIKASFIIRLTTGTPKQVLSKTLIDPKVWYHVCGVWNGIDGSMKIYMNGIEDTTPIAPLAVGTLANSSYEVMIGSAHSTTTANYLSFPGNIAGLWMWDRALDPADVLEHANDPWRLHEPNDTEEHPSFFSFVDETADIDVDALDTVVGAPAETGDIQIDGLTPVVGAPAELSDISVEGLIPVVGALPDLALIEILGLDAVIGASVGVGIVEISGLNPVVGAPAPVGIVEILGLDAVVGASPELAEIPVEGLDVAVGSQPLLATIEIEGIDALTAVVAEIGALQVDALTPILGEVPELASVDLEALDLPDLLTLLAEVEVETLTVTLPPAFLEEFKLWCVIAKKRTWKLAPKSRVAQIAEKARVWLLARKNRTIEVPAKAREARIAPKSREWRLKP